jgi:hypothetical protein
MTEPRNIADGFIARGARLLVSEVAEDALDDTALFLCSPMGRNISGQARSVRGHVTTL